MPKAFWVLTIGTALVFGACSGGLNMGTQSDSEGGGTTASCTAPACVDIHAAILAQNSTGIRPEASLNAVVLPEFDCSSGTPIHSISDLPSWLKFSSEALTLDLNSVAQVPSDATQDYSVTYTATVGDNTFSSEACVINDSDGDGIGDGVEYDNRGILNSFPTGYLLLDPETELLYFPEDANGSKLIPSAIIISEDAEIDVTQADAQDDFDLDGLTNYYEMIIFNTNPLIYTAAAGFSTSRDYSVGDLPAAMITADFDRDGDLDIMVGNINGNSISILRGNGDGTFAAAQDWALVTRPQLFTVGRFNDDQYFDVAVPSITDDNISVFLWEADGTSELAGTYATLTDPVTLATNDVNGDKALDLVVGYDNNSNREVSVFLGNGDGTFQTPRLDYEMGSTAVMVILVDINKDGRLDIVATGGEQQTISIIFGQTDGTFANPVNHNVGNPTVFVSAGDFDDDRDIDLVFTDKQDSMSVMLNAGDGTFPVVDEYDFGSATEPSGAVASDFDGDAISDIALVNADTDQLSIFYGYGDGTFMTEANYNTGTSPLYLNVGDYNNDKRVDIVVANSGSDSVTVFINQ